MTYINASHGVVRGVLVKEEDGAATPPTRARSRGPGA
jgi:hypothetical protein